MPAWKTLRLSLALLLGAAAAHACGGPGRSSGFEPESVPSDKPIPDLDPSEQDAFCDEAIEWAEDFLKDTLPRLLCRTEGISAGATQSGFDVAACEAAERDCLATDEFDVDELTCNVTELDEDCDATVGEFAACFEEAASLSRRLLAELSCGGVGAGNVPDETDYEITAACQALLDRCGGSSQDNTDDETGTGGETGSEPPPG